jgi:hypothetical protein
MNYDGVRESEFFMKKFILMLLVVLLMPVTVLAETCHADGVTIESIEMIEKSEGSKELSPAKANGTSMDLDISFTREKDYIIYKVVIKNNTENDYVLDEAMFTKNYNNVSYKFETDNKLVKAGNVRELSLRVELISVPEKFHKNSYVKISTFMLPEIEIEYNSFKLETETDAPKVPTTWTLSEADKKKQPNYNILFGAETNYYENNPYWSIQHLH